MYIKTYDFPFQVNTFGLEAIKKMLCALYDKLPLKNKTSFFGHPSCYGYLQFWGGDEFRGVTHYTEPFHPKTCQIISIEEAVASLNKMFDDSQTKDVSLILFGNKIILHTNGDVTCGCAKIFASAVDTIINQRKKLLDSVAKIK